MKKSTKRWLSLMLTLVMLLGMVPAFDIAARAVDEVSYRVGSWDDTTQTVDFTEESISTYTVVDYDTTTWENGWYVVNGTVTVNGRITVNRTVNLILCDGATLVANGGIRVEGTNTLNIFGQAEGTGTLTAKAETEVEDYYSAIGGDLEQDAVIINIHGGTVTATGDMSGAGIGGGYYGAGGEVTVYGGAVTANGDMGGAGIGGGVEGAGGEVAIYGGTVTAYSNEITGTGTEYDGKAGSGIGSGLCVNNTEASNGSLTVADGLTVFGGTSADSMDVIEKDSSGDYARYQYMKVDKIPVTGVTLDPTSVTLAVDETVQLTANVAPSNATDTSVTWSSSDETVATVDENGLVSAVGAGTATITVTTNDGGKKASCDVTVVVPVTGVSLNKSTTTLNVGGSETLTATVAPNNATNKGVTWSSSDTSVATVNNNGVVSAVSAGAATITVTTNDGSKKANCNVTVVVPVTGVSLNKSATTLNVGGSETLTATVAPNNATNKGVTWSSSDTSVATVNNNGVVSAVGAGTATITVTTNDGNKKANCNVTVVVPVTGVTLNKSTTTLTVGDQETLSATISPENATDKGITWTSSDETVATVSNGVVSAVGAGTATITVRTNDGNKEATCDVTVYPTYTVTWKNADGTVLETDTGVHRGTIPSYGGETPTKEEDAQYTYTFKDWDPEPAAVTDDAIYTATYTPTTRQYTVTFDSDGGTAVAAQQIEYGNIATEPAAPTKDGYDFDGWYNGDIEFLFNTEIKENIELKAKWVEAKILITEDMIELEDTDFYYDGEPKTPSVNVIIDGMTLWEDLDYTVTYANNVNPGIATITVTGIDDYKGTVTVTFNINVMITVVVEEDDYYEESYPYAYKSAVSLDINDIYEAPEGKVFSCWRQNDPISGKLISKNANLSFIARSNMILYAVFEDVQPEPEAVTAITSVNKSVSSSGKNAIEFVYSRSVPQDWKVTSQGLYYATNKLLLGSYVDKNGDTLDMDENLLDHGYDNDEIREMLINKVNGVKENKGTSTARNGTTSFKYAVAGNIKAYVYAVSYVTGTKADGTPFTVYSDAEVITYENAQ